MQTQQRHGLRTSAHPPTAPFLTFFFCFSSFPHVCPLSIINFFPLDHRSVSIEMRKGSFATRLPISPPLIHCLPKWCEIQRHLLTPRDEILAAITGNKSLPISSFPLPIRLDLLPLFCFSGCLGLSHWRCGFMNGNQYPFRHKAKRSLLCNYCGVMSPQMKKLSLNSNS